MLRLLRRLGRSAGSYVLPRFPAAFGAVPRKPNSLPVAGFGPRPNLPFVNGAGFKPSLTLFWQFMARQAPAP
jgi:hypothetical protein